MHNRYEHKGLVWVDLESPTREEIRSVVEEFGVDLLTGEELILPSLKPRADFHDTYAYLVLHFPSLHARPHKSGELEVDFIVGRNFLITTRYDMIDPLHDFSKILEVNSLLDKSNIGDHAGFMLYYMLKKLYQSVEHEVELVKRNLATIEEHVFSGHEILMVQEISRTARDLLNLRQTIEPHREALHALEIGGKAFFGDAFVPYLRSLSDEYYRVHNHVMRAMESLHELRETNNSLLTTKQNETMKRFTIISFFTFPLMLFAAVFSMDAKNMPIVGTAYDFWVLIALMVFGACCMYWYFKKTRMI
jgi:magnesium transporter